MIAYVYYKTNKRECSKNIHSVNVLIEKGNVWQEKFARNSEQQQCSSYVGFYKCLKCLSDNVKVRVVGIICLKNILIENLLESKYCVET